MVKKYFIQLFTFTLYFIIIYVNVTAANAMVKLVPWDHSALNSQCPKDSNDESLRCEKTNWNSEEDIQLTSDVIKTLPNTNLDDCLNACMENNNCVAITMKKLENNDCHFLGRKYQRQENEEYDSHILKCCTFQDPPPRPPDVISPPSPPGPAGMEFDLPAISYFDEACQDDPLSSSKSTWWLVIENVDFAQTPDKSMTNTNTLECQRQCAKDNACRAVSVEWNGKVCHFFNTALTESMLKKKRKIYYEKTICVLDRNRLLHRKKHLLITANYQPFCQQISEPKRKQKCTSLIWFFVDETRFYSEYNIFELNTIDECLNECLKSDDCYTVSVDHSQRKCYVFTGFNQKKSRTLDQPAWSTFRLQCCNQPKLQ